MEKTSNLTKKLVIAISSIVVCVMLIGVVVYAALSQNVNLSNTITVTTGGQAKSIVTVYEQVITGNTAVTALPATEPTWGDAILTKDENTDSANKDLTPIEFSYSNGKNIYAYKIVVQNKSTGTVKIAISSSTESNTEVDVYCGETYATATKLDNTKGVNFEETGVATDGEVTYYIFVCSNTALESMTAATAQDFDIDIVVTAE